MRNIKYNLLSDDLELLDQYEKAQRYFNIHARSTPAPYRPARNHLLSEAEWLTCFCRQNQEINNALSLYLHIPFCQGKCRFCDLYCFQVPLKSQSIVNDYVQALELEIEHWARLIDWKYRPITTVHFGGGSPLILAHHQLERILDVLRANFNFTAQTELAVEITTSQMTTANYDFLKKQNITRIHIGVQTLADEIRQLLGRRERAETIRMKLKNFLSESFITSVDLIYGLSLQNWESFASDLEEFLTLGIDGFALYELQITKPLLKIMDNRPALAVDKLHSLQLFLRAKKALNQSGYRNIFFNHFGNRRDHNLYFTFPSRHEDCLAFGTIADGQVGVQFYRHKKLKKYLESVFQGNFGIEFGYLENHPRQIIREFETQLMSTHIEQASIEKMNAQFGMYFKGIFDFWCAVGLLDQTNDQANFELSGSGCWLLSIMTEQLRRLEPAVISSA